MASLLSIALLLCWTAHGDVKQLLEDDECNLPGASCAAHALQLRAKVDGHPEPVEVSEAPAPPPLTENVGNLPLEAEEYHQDITETYRRKVEVPLHQMGMRFQQFIDDAMPGIVQEFTSAKETKDYKVFLEVASTMQNLLSDSVLKLMRIRNKTVAVMGFELDRQQTPKAAKLQDDMLQLMIFSSIGAVTVMEQLHNSFGPNASGAIAPGIKDGITGSLRWLEPSLSEAWEGMQKLTDNFDSYATHKIDQHDFVIAGCAADFAKSLSYGTDILVSLTHARRDCQAGEDKPVNPQLCAADAIKALGNVEASLGGFAEVNWQCFGLSWVCSQLMNQALTSMMLALSSSLVMSSNCRPGGDDVCKTATLQALSHLSKAAGAMPDASDSCHLIGEHYTPAHAKDSYYPISVEDCC